MDEPRSDMERDMEKEMEKEIEKEIEKQVTNWVTVAITVIIQVIVMFVIALVLFKLVWAWVVPDLFPGAVDEGLIVADLTWLTALKLGVLVAVLGGFPPALSNAVRQQ
ncbi:MAG: hypothetical protein GTO18_12550 [Anaerolineales bacterium]|nr:hypothetical protein [Anaerolineales bacterium]